MVRRRNELARWIGGTLSTLAGSGSAPAVPLAPAAAGAIAAAGVSEGLRQAQEMSGRRGTKRTRAPSHGTKRQKTNTGKAKARKSTGSTKKPIIKAYKKSGGKTKYAAKAKKAAPFAYEKTTIAKLRRPSFPPRLLTWINSWWSMNNIVFGTSVANHSKAVAGLLMDVYPFRCIPVEGTRDYSHTPISLFPFTGGSYKEADETVTRNAPYGYYAGEPAQRLAKLCKIYDVNAVVGCKLRLTVVSTAQMPAAPNDKKLQVLIYMSPRLGRIDPDDFVNDAAHINHTLGHRLVEIPWATPEKPKVFRNINISIPSLGKFLGKDFTTLHPSLNNVEYFHDEYLNHDLRGTPTVGTSTLYYPNKSTTKGVAGGRFFSVYFIVPEGGQASDYNSKVDVNCSLSQSVHFGERLSDVSDVSW